MRRLFSFIFKLVVFIALVLWLADRPGTARIEWHGYEIETSAAFLGVCVIGAGFVIYILLRIWRFLKNGPEMWRLRRKLNKLNEGHRQFTEGLIAVAAGNAAEAGRFAIAARKALGVTPATRLLQAQAAQLAGDRTTAREIFLALASEPDSAVLGYRGLITEALRAGDRAEAEKLAEKLRRLRPETPWLNLIRFELAAQHGQWNEAEAALDRATEARLVEPNRARRQQAATLLATAQEEARQGHKDQALQAAERAAKLAPGWLPAVIILTQQQVQSGHARAARRPIERIWVETPHPQLARIYRMLGGNDAVAGYKQVEQLCRLNEDNPASRLALAEAAIAADLWGEARRHLLALTGQSDPPQAAFRLLAQLEKRESHNEQAASQWLIYAADAAPDPVWLCRVCGGAQEEWQASCRHCQSFNSLDWQSPGQSRVNSKSPPGVLTAWAD